MKDMVYYKDGELHTMVLSISKMATNTPTNNLNKLIIFLYNFKTIHKKIK